MLSNRFILCHAHVFLPSVFPSIRVFSNESAVCIRWPKYWCFKFSIRPSSEYSGLISFRIDWFDLLAVQGTLKSLFQHHSSKALVLHCSAFFMVQLSYLYMTAGKTIALTRWTFVGKVMYLLFYILSRFAKAFLPRSKNHLIFLAGFTICRDFGAQEKKICSCFYFSHFCLPWSEGAWCHDPPFFNNEFSSSFFTLLYHPHKRLFSSSLSAIRVVSSVYWRLLIFLPTILIPACDSFSPAFHMVYSADKLSKQSDYTALSYSSKFWTRQLFHVRF